MKFYAYILFFLSAGSVMSQFQTRFSQFQFAKALLNPAATGLEARYTVEILQRNQWLGLPGAPQTTGVVGSAELLETMAVGVTYVYERVGITAQNTVGANYAYRAMIDDYRSVCFGVAVQAVNTNTDYSLVPVADLFDPSFDSRLNTWNFNTGAGVYYNGGKFYAGLSVPQMFTNAGVSRASRFSYRDFHYYGTVGYYTGTNRYLFNPSIQLRSVPNSPIQGDILLRNIFKQKWSLSLGYRSENALIASFDVMVKNVMRVGYSFNYNIGPIRPLSATSHELYLAFGLPFYYDNNPFAKRKYFNRKGHYKKDFKRVYRRYKMPKSR